METNTPEKISEQPQENIKLTKKGKPDRRSLTSKSNIQKAQSSVKEIIQKAKQKKAPPPLESEDDNDDSSDSDTEYVIQPVLRSSVHTDQFLEKEVHKRKEVDDDIMLKFQSLTKSIDELKSENMKLKSNFIENDRIQSLNSLTKKMLLKF